jgi:DNA-binding transcriptional MerR regulator
MERYIAENKLHAFMDTVTDRLDLLEDRINRMYKRQKCLDGDELLDTQDLCLLLKTSKRTLQRYRKNGLIAFHSIEGKVYYKSSDIHEFIRNSFRPAGKSNETKKETL